MPKTMSKTKNNIPTNAPQTVVGYTIYSNGQAVSDTFQLLAIDVQQAINQIGKASLVIAAGSLVNGGLFGAESEAFSPGSQVKIAVGERDHQSVVYEGVVSAQKLQIDDTSIATLEISCFDYAFPSTLERKNKVYTELKDSDVIAQLFNQYPMLAVTVEPTHHTHAGLVQYNCSDWDFILSRAEANGMVVITNGRTVKVVRPALQVPTVLSVSYGANLIAFNGTLSSAAQTTAVQARTWDPANQEIVRVTASLPLVNQQGKLSPLQLAAVHGQQTNLQNNTANEQGLQDWADAQWLMQAMGRYQGTIKIIGSASVVPGCLIELKGLGSSFDGHAYAGAVRHQLAAGNWHTTISMGISPSQVNASPVPAAMPLPVAQGLQIGKVIAIANDPTNEGRIKIAIPLLSGMQNEVWARLASFWASNNHGAFFMPDIGDEVVVGFFNNETDQAIVLGSLYSSNRPAALLPNDENQVKSIISKSRMQLVFDEEKKCLTFSTPANNVLALSDADGSIKLTDQHNNQISMSAHGITIASTSSLLLKAVDGIKVSAGSSLNINSNAEIDMQAIDIKANAAANFSAKGGATAELSAAGQVSVKGGIVAIN